jgi:hypothetical protein
MCKYHRSLASLLEQGGAMRIIIDKNSTIVRHKSSLEVATVVV